jgi:hypothetical protein
MKTQQIAVVGIDGSGKSTQTRVLPHLVAGKRNQTCGSVGDQAMAIAPDCDLAMPDFAPRGLPFSLRMARVFGRAAKRFVARRRLYAFLKLVQLILQDLGARAFAKRYGLQILFTDGHPLISAAARAGNCFNPASVQGVGSDNQCTSSTVADNMRYLLFGRALPKGTPRFPWIRTLRVAQRLSLLFGRELLSLPDAVVFLDLGASEAKKRIAERGAPVDPHENQADLYQARMGYRRALAAFAQVQNRKGAVVVLVNDLDSGAVTAKTHEALQGVLACPGNERSSRAPELHAPMQRLVGKVFVQIAFGGRYLKELFLNAFFGAWREPLFVLSKSGRDFLREGYSAQVMRTIYEGHRQRRDSASWAERVFLDHPLHQAVSDRLDCLRPRIQEALWRHATGTAQGKIRILSAPSGLSDDLFGALAPLRQTHRALLERVEVVAVDLDPAGDIETALRARAQALGISLTFLRGDLTSPELQNTLLSRGPFHLALFVGLSSWLPKGDLLSHLALLRGALTREGLLICDAFAADRYALSGQAAGYKAHYHDVPTFAALLDLCGFEGSRARIGRGRNGINAVFTCGPRPEPRLQAA